MSDAQLMPSGVAHVLQQTDGLLHTELAGSAEPGQVALGMSQLNREISLDLLRWRERDRQRVLSGARDALSGIGNPSPTCQRSAPL